MDDELIGTLNTEFDELRIRLYRLLKASCDKDKFECAYELAKEMIDKYHKETEDLLIEWEKDL